jgi:hypothetical protein
MRFEESSLKTATGVVGETSVGPDRSLVDRVAVVRMGTLSQVVLNQPCIVHLETEQVEGEVEMTRGLDPEETSMAKLHDDHLEFLLLGLGERTALLGEEIVKLQDVRDHAVLIARLLPLLPFLTEDRFEHEILVDRRLGHGVEDVRGNHLSSPLLVGIAMMWMGLRFLVLFVQPGFVPLDAESGERERVSGSIVNLQKAFLSQPDDEVRKLLDLERVERSILTVQVHDDVGEIGDEPVLIGWLLPLFPLLLENRFEHEIAGQRWLGYGVEDVRRCHVSSSSTRRVRRFRWQRADRSDS